MAQIITSAQCDTECGRAAVIMCEVHRSHFLLCSTFSFVSQLSTKRETCGDKSRQLRDAQQDARDKVEVKKCFLALNKTSYVINHSLDLSTM